MEHRRHVTRHGTVLTLANDGTDPEFQKHPVMEYIKELESELAALRADAQLARDLRAIEAAGWACTLSSNTEMTRYGAEIFGMGLKGFSAPTREQAVAAARAWVEQEGKA